MVDLGWEKQGRYLLSTGLDQTTRLHAPWVQESVDEVRATELSIVKVFLFFFFYVLRPKSENVSVVLA